MRVRHIYNHDSIGFSGDFNTAGIGEVIVYYDDGGASSEFISKLEVQLSDDSWINLSEGFKNKTVIPDNYNTRFIQSKNDKDRKLGYYN